MTTKQFAVFLVVLIAICAIRPGNAQSGYVMVPAQTSLAGCTWPTAYVTVSNGMALCPLNLTSGPALAIAVNGGPFVQIPMTSVAAGVVSFNGRTGSITLTKADVTATGLTATTTAATTATTSLQ